MKDPTIKTPRFVLNPDFYRSMINLQKALTRMRDRCNNCHRQIKVTIFRGSGYCSDDCRKELLLKEEVKLEQARMESLEMFKEALLSGEELIIDNSDESTVPPVRQSWAQWGKSLADQRLSTPEEDSSD